MKTKSKSKKKWVSTDVDAHIFNMIDILLMSIIVVSILVFILWPILSVFLKSFLINGKVTTTEYTNLFRKNRTIIVNSVMVSTLTTLITMVFSIGISIYERYSPSKIKKIIFPMLLLTMISPPFVSSLSYISLFGRRGFITHRVLGLTVNPYGWHGIIAMQALSEISLTTILIIGVMRGIDKNIINASRDLGSSPNQVIKRVIIPVAKPGILVATFIVFVKSLADFGTPIIIGGSFKVLATESYLTVIGRSNLSKASAMSMLILIPSMIAFSFYRYYIKDMNIFAESSSKSFESGEVKLEIDGILNKALSLLTWCFIMMMLVQYLSIIFSAITYYNGKNYIFTLEHIKNMRFGKWNSFIRSIVYSLIAAISTGFIGVLLSYYIERRKFKGSKIVDFIATLPYIIPGTFFGIGYILAFNKAPLKLTGTAIIVVLNCVFRQIPIATKAGSAALSNVSLDIENAARDLGTPRIFIIKDIILPLLKPAFLISFINTFTSTMTTVGAIIFIISPNAKVATVEMFNTLRDGDYGVGAVISTLIIFSTLIINIGFSKIINRKGSL